MDGDAQFAVSEPNKPELLVRVCGNCEALRGQLLSDVSQLLHRAQLDLANSLSSDV